LVGRAIWSFFTARRYAKCGICRRRVSVRLFVCVSVTFWYCIKMAKCRITQIMPHDMVFKFCSCRISTDKCLALSLCHSRASCLPRDARLSAVYAAIVCLCVSVSVTHRYCIKTAKRMITQITPHDSSVTLIF